jgi:hypothetical protein
MRLKSVLEAILESSRSLQQAIIRKKTDHVWEILSGQERMLGEIEQYSYLWGRLHGTAGAGADPGSDPDPAMSEYRRQLRETAGAIQAVARSNATLCRNFLSAIRKAISNTGTTLANQKMKVKTYGKHGRINVNKSFLVSRTG